MNMPITSTATAASTRRPSTRPTRSSTASRWSSSWTSTATGTARPKTATTMTRRSSRARKGPGNPKDEDCDGTAQPYPDADADRVAEPADCDDHDPAIFPGAKGIPGNKVDENCDGVVAPFPPIGSSVHSSFQVIGGLTKVVDMTVSDVPKDATIQLHLHVDAPPACQGRARWRRWERWLRLLQEIVQLRPRAAPDGLARRQLQQEEAQARGRDHGADHGAADDRPPGSVHDP